MQPSTKENRKGKNSAKSRVGVIFSCMLFQQIKVPTILKAPHKNPTNTTNGMKSEYILINVPAIKATVTNKRMLRVLNRNSILNSTGNITV